MRGKSLITRAIRCLLLTGLLLSMLSSFAQAPNQLNGSIEEPLVAADIQAIKSLFDRNSLGQALDGPDDCDLKFPYPQVAAKKDPYAENGAEICKNLQIRGQRMQCEIELGDESPEVIYQWCKIGASGVAVFTMLLCSLLYYISLARLSELQILPNF